MPEQSPFKEELCVGNDLRAATCLYHRSCDMNFRTNYGISMRHGGGSTTKKTRKVGRLMNMDQEQAFLRMCAFLENNDEEQLTHRSCKENNEVSCRRRQCCL